jgi:hypothetical protein
LNASPNIIRAIKTRNVRWASHTAHIGEMINTYKYLVGKHEGKIPLGRPRSRWEGNIKMTFREIMWEGVD